jgi:hypothetical protein
LIDDIEQMGEVMNSENDMTLAAGNASKMFEEIIDRLVKANLEYSKGVKESQQGRLFFPNGIELLYLKFKVGDNIDISFASAGKDVPIKIASTLEAAATPEGGWISSGGRERDNQ